MIATGSIADHLFLLPYWPLLSWSLCLLSLASCSPPLWHPLPPLPYPLHPPTPLHSRRSILLPVASPSGQALPCSLLRLVLWSAWSVLLVLFSFPMVSLSWLAPSLHTSAECDVVSFTVRAFLLCVAPERAWRCNAPHNIPLMGAGAVWPWAVAACWFAAAYDPCVAPSAAMITSAVWAYIREWLDVVPHSTSLDAFIDLSPCHLVPLYYKDNWQCRDFPSLSPFPDAVRVCQPSHLHLDYHSFLLSMDLVRHLVQALCGFAHVPHEWYCMDFQRFPEFVFFNIKNSLLNCMCCVDDVIAVRQCYRHHCIVEGDCNVRARYVSFHFHNLDVGWCLLVAQHSVEHRRNLLVYLVWQWYALVSHQNLTSLSHAPSRCWGGAWAARCLLARGSGLESLSSFSQSGSGLRSQLILLFILLFELQFWFGMWLLLQLVLLWFTALCCTCML